MIDMMKITNGFNEMGTVKEENGKYVVYNRNGQQWRKFDNMFFMNNFLKSVGLMIVGK